MGLKKDATLSFQFLAEIPIQNINKNRLEKNYEKKENMQQQVHSAKFLHFVRNAGIASLTHWRNDDDVHACAYVRM